MKSAHSKPVSAPLSLSGGWLAVLPMLFVALALFWSQRAEVVDDEGILALIGAQLVASNPIDALFALKFHPLGSGLLAPFSGFGWQAWRLLHIGIGALSVWLIADAARSMGKSPWIAGVVTACSPALLVSASSGQSNVLGVFAQATALWLYGRGRINSLAAILGVLPLIRAELGLISICSALALALRWPARRLRLALIAAIAPVLYAIAASVYHADVLFWIHVPPSIPKGVPYNEVYGFPDGPSEALMMMLTNLAYVCAIWPVAFARRWRRRASLGKLAFASAAMALIVLTVLPLTGGFADFPWPRYLLLALPGLALSITDSTSKPRVEPLTCLIAALIGVWTITSPQQPDAFQQSLLTPSAAALMDEIRDKEPDSMTYTPNMAIAWALAQRKHPVRFVPSHDVHYELWRLLNRANGQYHRLIDSLTPLLYGGAMWPCEFLATNTGRASVWIGDVDPRHSKLKGPLIGSKAHCKTEHGYRVCRGFQRALSQAWDPILDEAIMAGPCSRAHPR